MYVTLCGSHHSKKISRNYNFLFKSTVQQQKNVDVICEKKWRLIIIPQEIDYYLYEYSQKQLSRTEKKRKSKFKCLAWIKS